LDQRELFLSHISIERGLSKNTIDAYQSDLAHFFNFLNENPSRIDHDFILRYLNESTMANSTKDRHLSTLKSYFKFLAIEGLIAEDPTSKLHTRNKVLRLPKSLTLDEINTILDLISLDKSQGIRDKALIELLYGTGVRISEATQLDLEDLDLVDGWIRIRFAKGAKQRLVPIGSSLRLALDTYLVRARPGFVKENQRQSALFLSTRGTRLTRQAAWVIVKTLAQRAKLDGVLSPHSLRHTFATHLLAGGADIRVVQELLGHSVVTTTQIYTKVNIDQVRDTFFSSHPRAR
jgi:integrase/recombinase XerD